jgi:hypothetical protein
MNKAEPTHYADVASWELADSLWDRIEPLLPKPKPRYRGRGKKRKHVGGRPAAERRKVMAGILYMLRTGGQWNAFAEGTIWVGEDRASLFPTVGAGRGLQAHVASGPERV